MEDPKRAVGEKAVEVYVRSGMVLGLGTGSTAVWAVRRVGELLSSGELEDIRGIPTSEETADLAREVGIPLTDLAEALPDIGIDGADEIGPGFALIKGRGGALLREKIVASAIGGIVVVAEGSKSVEELGQGPLPVEVEPFGW
ncbi:MAG: ribose 5-phosphate isomerase A, partial [Actinomycetota bacterium]|nr:ribose 5-phosphate isomerase A [Actinomycetota bacterium]